ncbi:MAG: hypothetical protein QNJ63_22630 [Calothrix sp. MO_192.B10]|nr:hypothetical protein [Calothrix sp. MO_192.B10]
MGEYPYRLGINSQAQKQSLINQTGQAMGVNLQSCFQPLAGNKVGEAPASSGYQEAGASQITAPTRSMGKIIVQNNNHLNSPIFGQHFLWLVGDYPYRLGINSQAQKQSLINQTGQAMGVNLQSCFQPLAGNSGGSCLPDTRSYPEHGSEKPKTRVTDPRLLEEVGDLNPIHNKWYK